MTLKQVIFSRQSYLFYFGILMLIAIFPIIVLKYIDNNITKSIRDVQYLYINNGTKSMIDLQNAYQDYIMRSERMNIELSIYANSSYSNSNVEKLPYLRDYKNPCWYESIQNKNYFQYPAPFNTSNQVNRRQLRCLPYFMIIGTFKSGTSDLYVQLSKHHQIALKHVPKEIHWWSRERLYVPFSNYLDNFEDACKDIERTVSISNNQTFHPKVTGDGSPSTFWDRDLYFKSSHLPTTHLLNSIIPRTKFILTLRNPVDMVLSLYRALQPVPSPEDFHRRLTFTVRHAKQCLMTKPAEYCALMMNRVFLQTGMHCHSNCTNMSLCIKYNNGKCKTKFLRIHIGLYSVYLKEWLETFPREQLFIVLFNDYVQNRTFVLQKTVDFLGLEPYESDVLDRLSRSGHNGATRRAPMEMLPSSRQMLSEFYEPFNRELASLLNDDRLLFLNK